MTQPSNQTTSTQIPIFNSSENALSSSFEPHALEAHWYEFWQEHGYFQPQPSNNDEAPFVVTIPPPNVTGVLHLGHALQHSMHDCLLRFHRMREQTTLCVPGTDHAGISTQIKVEQQLAHEGTTRQELGRDEFVRRAYEWKDKYGSTIINQMKRLGCSYDWSRERFTMDEGYVKAVLQVFKTWYDEGLIYRGFRLVNWSPGAQTNVSDLEVDFQEVNGKLWHFRYPVEDTSEYIVVATTRPETMLGDTAVAVHPDDELYRHLVGKRVRLPLTSRTIPIVADEYVDKEFGSGAVKITPAHDPNDYEIGQRHSLEMISVIGFDAKMTDAAGIEYSKLTREDARIKVVNDLQALGLVEKIEDYTHKVGHCARTGSVIEPLLSEQWFVRMKELARPVADAIRMNRVGYVPERFANTSLDWMDNIRDWCISRQLWWGHRIPVYYGPHGEIEVSVEPIVREGWTQDEDVLDTWFSSALWPFAVLGWPDNLETQFYPTSVLITGRDILNLWVSRMILMSLHFVDDEIPFQQVFVHPTVQDCFGLRMSKSSGTAIDPMNLIEIYGTDATRFGLLQLATGAQDVRFLDEAEKNLGEDFVRRWMKEHRGAALPLEWNERPTDRYPQMQNARNFANKIWNAARFVLNAGTLPEETDYADFDLAGRWILSRLNRTVEEVTHALKNYEFETATSSLYSFIWGDFCDWFVELSKPKMRDGNTHQIGLLIFVLEYAMRLLHPFMPFLSEEIWQKLPKYRMLMGFDETLEGDKKVFSDNGMTKFSSGKESPSLCIATWPYHKSKSDFQGFHDEKSEQDFAFIQETIRSARNLRAEAKLPPSQKLKMQLFAANDEAFRVLESGRNYILQLANLSEVSIEKSDAPRPQNAVSSSLADVEIWLPLEGLVDKERETARLQKELESLQKDLAIVEKKLNNPQFMEKAAAAVVEKETAKRVEIVAAIAKSSTRLQEMKA